MASTEDKINFSENFAKAAHTYTEEGSFLTTVLSAYEAPYSVAPKHVIPDTSRREELIMKKRLLTHKAQKVEGGSCTPTHVHCLNSSSANSRVQWHIDCWIDREIEMKSVFRERARGCGSNKQPVYYATVHFNY